LVVHEFQQKFVLGSVLSFAKYSVFSVDGASLKHGFHTGGSGFSFMLVFIISSSEGVLFKVENCLFSHSQKC
jgi:hypothetical protein